MEGFGGDWHFRPGYVYIAHSPSGAAIKIGRTVNIRQQQGRLRRESYGSFSDWRIRFYAWVDEAGRVESDARRELKHYKFRRRYSKNGSSQIAREMLRCPYVTALDAVCDLLTPEQMLASRDVG